MMFRSAAKIGLFTALLLFLTANAFSQSLDLSRFKALRLRQIGPAGMSGRVTSIDAVLSDPDVIYIGTASGGLWKSENGAASFQPVFDKEALTSIGAVAITQQNPSIVWAGTGEGNPRNSHNSGKGIYKSIDAGKSWKLMGLEGSKTIHRIIVHPHNEDIVWVAAMGSAWGPNPERGVFKTTNGGKNWEKVLFVNDTTGCADLVIDPSNPNKLLASMWQYGREPWFFTSGGKGSGIYMSLDGGISWQRQGKENGLPEGELGRAGLAFSASSPNVAYALLESKNTALYRSDDGGFNWNKQADKDIGNRPFYYADIFVDPQNENRLYNLWSVVTVSEDGGKTFRTLAGGGDVHPDHHAFWIHPSNPDILIDGNDGGIAISRDKGRSWAFIANLPLGQFYHVDHDMEQPYNVMGGLQDNGSWVGPSQVLRYGGIRNFDWQEVAFGDGFDVASVPGKPHIVYAMSQGGHVMRIDRQTGALDNIRPVHPDGTYLRFNWNAAMALDPFSPSGLYFGSQFLHYSKDEGHSWQIISPDLSTNDSTKQRQALSGGLTLDATNAENHTTILAIAPSPINAGTIWVGTDDGNLQLTRDGGKTWKNLASKLPGLPSGSWIPQIVASSITAGEAFVVANDYRRNNWEPYLYHTRDFGQSWRRIADSKQVEGFCLSVVQDPVAENLLFLGTDQGLYLSLDGGGNWQKWSEGFPSVPVSDLKIHPREHDLILATFGRSLWVMDDIRPLRELAQKGTKVMEKPFFVLPSAPAINFELNSTRGVRFGGAGEFEGGNKPVGAAITYYWNPGKSDEKEKEKAGKEKNEEIKVAVLNAAGDTLRQFVQKPDTGFARFHWRFERDGFNWPSWRTRNRKQLPGGPALPFGSYKMVLSLGDLRDSTQIEILPDPRLAQNIADLNRREALIKEFVTVARAGTEGFEQLKSAKEMLENLGKFTDNLEAAQKDSLKKLAKPLADSIKVLQEVFLDPEDLKGLQHYLKPLASKYWEVSSYLEPLYSPIGENAENALNLFRRDVEGAIERINRFLRGDWDSFVKVVETLRPPLFKPLESVGFDR